jgi:hypothetical protein
MNLFTKPRTYPLFQPERGEAETQQDYRARRLGARRKVKQMTCKGLSGGQSQRAQLRKGKHKGRVRAADALMQHWASKRRDEGVYRKALNDWHDRNLNRFFHASAAR